MRLKKVVDHCSKIKMMQIKRDVLKWKIMPNSMGQREYVLHTTKHTCKYVTTSYGTIEHFSTPTTFNGH